MDLTLYMPESAFSAMRLAPEEFARELRIAAAAKWYELALVSQEKAAEIAGLSRSEFLMELGRFKVSPFQVTAAELEEELRHAD
ncbi:MAG: UPF0175 family protein [Magnetococcus sp. DMHC-1]